MKRAFKVKINLYSKKIIQTFLRNMVFIAYPLSLDL